MKIIKVKSIGTLVKVYWLNSYIPGKIVTYYINKEKPTIHYLIQFDFSIIFVKNIIQYCCYYNEKGEDIGYGNCRYFTNESLID